MSIYGAMYSGVSGLAAQSNALGVISDNISNVNTVGYKGSRTSFQTLVTQSTTQTTYTPGGVGSRPLQGVDKQGLLQGTSNATDLGISGNGMFVVNEAINPGVGDDVMFTRAGEFRPDEEGNLRNAAGFYLQGWPLDDNGNLPAAQQSINSVETVNVSNLTGLPRATDEITVGANLPAGASDSTPDGTDGTAHEMTIQMFDSLGYAHNLTAEFTRLTGQPKYTTQPVDDRTFALTDATNSLGVVDSSGSSPTTDDVLEISVEDGESYKIDVNLTGATPSPIPSPPVAGNRDTLETLAYKINNQDDTSGALGQLQADFINTNSSVANEGRLVITHASGKELSFTSNTDLADALQTSSPDTQYTGVGVTDPTTATLDDTTNSLGLSSGGTLSITTAGGDTYDITYNPTTDSIDDLAEAINQSLVSGSQELVAEVSGDGELQVYHASGEGLTFSDTGPLSGALQLTNTLDDNQWNMTLKAPVRADDPSGGLSGLFVGPTDPTTISEVITFDGDGAPVNVPAALEEFSIDWAQDPLLVPGGTGAGISQDIALDLGTAGERDGLTQFAGSEFGVSKINQNGLKFGNFTGVNVNEEGTLTAVFDNGRRKDIYQLPIAMFSNFNGLEEVSGNAYLQTRESGDFLLSEAGVGGAGDIAPSSVEQSTVDLAEEFTRMITTQRAYSASTKVITTSDEMLQELTQAIR